jgi:dipeptidyl aminopeptidase/acylaminoacyl peptidase
MNRAKPRTPGSSSKQLLRYITLAISAFIIIYLSVNFALAWFFVSGLIHPKCSEPQNLPGRFEPDEYWITTSDGLSIRIWYFPPKNGAVILSFGGLKGSLGSHIPKIDFLIDEGYGIIQVDSRACAIPRSAVTLGGYELLDAEAALKFGLAQAGVEPERIGVYGFSMGGATAIRLASRHTEINAVIRDGGYAKLDDLLTPSNKSSIQQRIFHITLYWLFRLRTGIDPQTINPLDDLRKVSPRPVLLIYGESEAAAGRLQQQVLQNPEQLWIVPGSGHGRNHVVAPDEYQKRVLEFFNRELLE